MFLVPRTFSSALLDKTGMPELVGFLIQQVLTQMPALSSPGAMGAGGPAPCLLAGPPGERAGQAEPALAVRVWSEVAVLCPRPPGDTLYSGQGPWDPT